MSGEIGKRIQEIRKSKHMKQTDLAELMGFSPSAISGWETGSRQVKSEELKKIADIFGVSVDHLLGRESPPTQPGGANSSSIVTKTIHLKKVAAEKRLVQKLTLLATMIFSILAVAIDSISLSSIFILLLVLFCSMEIVEFFLDLKNNPGTHINCPIEDSLVFIHRDGIKCQKKHRDLCIFDLIISFLLSVFSISAVITLIDKLPQNSSNIIIFSVLFLLVIALHIYLLVIEVSRRWIIERVPYEQSEKRFLVGRFQLLAFFDGLMFYFICLIIIVFRDQLPVSNLQIIVVSLTVAKHLFSLEICSSNYAFYSKFDLYSIDHTNGEIKRIL